MLEAKREGETGIGFEGQRNLRSENTIIKQCKYFSS